MCDCLSTKTHQQYQVRRLKKAAEVRVWLYFSPPKVTQHREDFDDVFAGSKQDKTNIQIAAFFLMLLFQPQCFYRCIKWIAWWILKGNSKRARCQVAKEALPLAKEFAAKQGKGISFCFSAHTPLIIIRSRVFVPNSYTVSVF